MFEVGGRSCGDALLGISLTHTGCPRTVDAPLVQSRLLT